MTSSWSIARVATALALSVWAAAFWYLMATDRLSFYLASRTTWLAPVGAISLTAAALGRLATARVERHEGVSRRQLRDLAVLVLPAIVLLSLPPLTLGSYAAGRRPASLAGAYSSTGQPDIPEGDLSLIDIFGLISSNDLDELASRAGTTSSFVGFVSRDGRTRADEFLLNRFMVSCCPGDAVLVSLRIVGAPPGSVEVDDWVRVTGEIYPVGRTVVVHASDVEKVTRPKHPYLDQSQ